MPNHSSDAKTLVQSIIDKASMKQEVYQKTQEVFTQFKTITEQFVNAHKKTFKKASHPLLFEYRDRGTFEFQLKFGSDILIFFMHSNVFEIPRDYLVMKSSYIQDNKARSYCGIIHIFNFLSDSFKFNRTNDMGYCIGRIFVNFEKHYFIEGKKELGLLFNNFTLNVLDKKALTSILYSAVQYTLHFDLLTPPYDNIKEVTVSEMQTALDAMKISTGKRLGFRFQADEL